MTVAAPKRVQLRRTKGWRMPEHCRSVARPGWFGNPWKIGKELPDTYGGGVVRDRAHAVEVYRAMVERFPIMVTDARTCLAGWDLACWCPLDQPCHADVLLEMANASGQEGMRTDGTR